MYRFNYYKSVSDTSTIHPIIPGTKLLKILLLFNPYFYPFINNIFQREGGGRVYNFLSAESWKLFFYLFKSIKCFFMTSTYMSLFLSLKIINFVIVDKF